MAKRMYANVISNGVYVNLSIRASSEKEARIKLETFPEYRGVSQIIDVSSEPPRKWKDEIEEVETPYRGRGTNKRHTRKHVFSGHVPHISRTVI